MEEYMSYEEYLEKVKTGILTKDGNCPVTPVLIMPQGKWKTQVSMNSASMSGFVLAN